MPLTWFAHQVPVIGMKLGRPRWFDATALCIGSMTPDLLYAVSSYLRIDTHRAPEAFTYGLPVAVLLSVAVRRFLAPIGPAHLPDVGAFRLRSFGVLACRRPRPVATIVSAFLGMGSHIVMDWFTHPGRPGAQWLGYHDVSVTVLGVTEPLSGLLQLIGHTLGSLGGAWLLWVIGRRDLLTDWYGADAVSTARSWVPTSHQRLAFWSTIALGAFIGALWGAGGEPVEFIHRAFAGALVGAFAIAATQLRSQARWINEVPTRSPGAGAGHDDGALDVAVAAAPWLHRVRRTWS